MESNVVKRDDSIDMDLFFKVYMGRSTILKAAHFKLKVTSVKSFSFVLIYKIYLESRLLSKFFSIISQNLLPYFLSGL